MHAKSSFSIALLCIAGVILWLSCSGDRPIAPNDGVFPVESDAGARLFDWAIGPIDGITTAWHAVPRELTVPVGTVLKIKCGARLEEPLIWKNAVQLSRDEQGAIAQCRFDREGSYFVEATIGFAQGDALVRKGPVPESQGRRVCLVTAVDASLADVGTRDLRVSSDPLLLSESSTNFETMQRFFAGGDDYQRISALRQIGPTRYRTATKRLVSFEAIPNDRRFAPLVEVRVSGRRPRLATRFQETLDGIGEHVISVGPPSLARQVTFETYQVVITSHASYKDVIREGSPITYVAVTEPAGFEGDITWISSTKYGTARPVVGEGRTFTVTFENTFGVESNATFQWLGVRADNAVFDQDRQGPGAQICCNCDCYFSTDCAEGSTCDYGASGHMVEDNCNWRKPKPDGVVGGGCTEDHPAKYSYLICDGLCVTSERGSVLGSEELSLTTLAINLWSDAMTSAAAGGGGPMNRALVAEALSLPFDWPHAAQAVGRQVGSLMVMTRGQEFFTHPHGEHDMEDHAVADLSNDPCRLEAGNLVIEALLAEIANPGSGRDIVMRVPGACPNMAGLFAPVCADANALDCLYSRVTDVAAFLSTPLEGR